jgi:hypothetical protein
MKRILILLAILFGSLALSFSQSFPTQTGGSENKTNILSPVFSQGILTIDYNFFSVPDTMDVYDDDANIFSSGLVSGTGRFVIPYGPGSSTSLTIVMDQAIGSPGTLWQYTPTVEPVPEPGSLSLFGLGLLLTTVGCKRKTLFNRPKF